MGLSNSKFRTNPGPLPPRDRYKSAHAKAHGSIPALSSTLPFYRLLAMPSDSSILSSDNAKKSFVLAAALFPHEEWVFKEANIWVAKSRLLEECREPDKWEREMSQVRILTNLEVDSVRAKIAGELKNRSGKGYFTCYFEHIGKLYSWSYDELRSIIGR